MGHSKRALKGLPTFCFSLKTSGLCKFKGAVEMGRSDLKRENSPFIHCQREAANQD